MSLDAKGASMRLKIPKFKIMYIFILSKSQKFIFARFEMSKNAYFVLYVSLENSHFRAFILALRVLKVSKGLELL